MLFETDVVLMNLEAGQKPKLTAEWGKRSLSHSRGSPLWQASRWPFVEITNQIRERERVRGRCTFSTTARPPTQIAFSCCHWKNVLIKTERKFTCKFSDDVFLSSRSTRQVTEQVTEWPLVTSGELQNIGVNSVNNLREQLSCFLHRSVKPEQKSHSACLMCLF